LHAWLKETGVIRNPQATALFLELVIGAGSQGAADEGSNPLGSHVGDRGRERLAKRRVHRELFRKDLSQGENLVDWFRRANAIGEPVGQGINDG